MAVFKKDELKQYLSAVRAHRRTLDRLLDRQGMTPLRKLYDRTQDELERDLRRLLGRARAAPLTPVQAQVLLQRFREVQLRLAVKLSEQLEDVMQDAQTEAVRQMARTLSKMEMVFVGGSYTPSLEEPAVMGRLVERRKAALATANAPAWERMAKVLTDDAAKALAQALVEDEDADEAVAQLRKKADDDFFMGARIIHTATARAFNVAQADAIDETAKDVPALQKRWCELVDDFTGEPMDDRVGQDSMVLHGQVAERTGLFVMPQDLRVSAKMWGQTYYCSPNRPNDRSVTMPWRPGLGLPSWTWRNGTRVELPRG